MVNSSTQASLGNWYMPQTISATDSGSINRFLGRSTPAQESDQVAPGIIDVTLMPVDFNSSRSALEKPSKANLEML